MDKGGGAYFMGRGELLRWLNTTLNLKLSKVEQICTGAVPCQLMDALHPGVVPMHKLKFDAKSEYDSVCNFKVLQEVFNKLKITKEVEVTRLIKGKPLDNMEFLQWLKIYHDEVTCGAGISDYNAEERRALSKGGNAFMKRKVQASKTTKGTKSYTRPGPASGTESSARTTARTTTTKQSAAEAKKLKELEEKNTSLKLSVDSLEQERDFYFAKLRDIEILCADRSLENNQVVKAVQTILFATEEYDIEGLIKQAGEKNAAADKVSVEKNITEEATVDLQPPSREPNGADQGTEKEAVTPKLEQTAKKQQTPTMDQVGKENVPSEAVVFSKSPLLPCEDCGVNFLEDTSGVDTLLKTSPFTLHNM